MQKIVAVTACPTGIAHTYMAAEKLTQVAHAMGLHIKVETQGAMGIEHKLSALDIASADVVIIASDIKISELNRFEHSHIFTLSIEEILIDASKALKKCLSK
ncbi:phosphotransferase system fructose-specific component IIB [Psychromonas sp. CNPT3]|uniref:PTS fructose transporter subunit IIB n=1 Tax=Psychromonas sp. CNPT3 TaxID=314282 RepID=UPI00006E70BE|nr:PTS fructose transporter subunit IIB [Psychromonas sp. CNPT3]AGH80139.1 phosphotransferase system fructose-specific component IIB [Psychromonas sp. CNPT3]